MVPEATHQPHPLRPALSQIESPARHPDGPRLRPVRVAVLGFAAALLLVSSTRASAQDSSPVFRARTELVRLDVSVTGKDGRPVTDLRADEIEVAENGKRRPVILFRHVTGTRADADATSGVFEEVSHNNASSPGHLYVLVFDDLHLNAAHAQRTRLAAERFLSREVKPGDAIAIYALPGPGPALDLTGDLIRARGRLRELQGLAAPSAGGVREFDAYRVARSGYRSAGIVDVSGPANALVDPVAAADVVGAESRSGEIAREQATRTVAQADVQGQLFLTSLAGVMRKMRVIEGRKTFVLFSEGFFVDNLGLQMEKVASAAAQSNSTVYAIDVNTPGAPWRSAAEVAERRDPLAVLAGETNGRLVTNAANLDQVLSRIAAETTDYYLVGFEPSGSEAPHDYHRVKVNVMRRGVVVRARTGYSATPAPTAFTERQAIDVALTVPRTCTAIPIAYTTYERIGEHADKPVIIASLTAHLPAFRPAAGQADVVFVVRDAVSGRAVASGTDQIQLPASNAGAPGHLEPVQYAVQFEVPPGEYWMRMLVREPGGVIGTADRRFHVWPLDTATLATSDLIVARLAGKGFDPPSEAVVRHGDEVLAYVEVYGTAAVDPAGAQVDVLRSDEVVATVDAVVKPGSHGETIVRARLPVSGLDEGQYSARVRIAAAGVPPRIVTRSFRVIAAERNTQ